MEENAEKTNENSGEQALFYRAGSGGDWDAEEKYKTWPDTLVGQLRHTYDFSSYTDW